MCDMANSYVCHGSFICVAWNILTCGWFTYDKKEKKWCDGMRRLKAPRCSMSRHHGSMRRHRGVASHGTCSVYVPREMAHVCSVRDGVPCEMAHTQNMFHEKWHTWDWTCSMDVPREMAHVCSVSDGVSCVCRHSKRGLLHTREISYSGDGYTEEKRWCAKYVPSLMEGMATHIHTTCSIYVPSLIHMCTCDMPRS